MLVAQGDVGEGRRDWILHCESASVAEIDGWKDVLADAQRRVWPKVAEAVAGTGGVLMGGTAVAIHLRHRTSVDLDVMSLEAFSGRMVADRLERLSSDVQIEDAAESCLRAIVDGVLVDVFRALGTEEASPDEMSMIQHGPVIDGMAVGSLPDLLATKLDVVMHRPKLRDYIDLAAIDAQTPYSLEDGLAFHQRRFGNKAGLWDSRSHRGPAGGSWDTASRPGLRAHAPAGSPTPVRPSARPA